MVIQKLASWILRGWQTLFFLSPYSHNCALIKNGSLMIISKPNPLKMFTDNAHQWTSTLLTSLSTPSNWLHFSAESLIVCNK